MLLVANQVDLYFDGCSFPAVRYVFYGETEAEAEESLLAHAKRDPILHGALTKKRVGSSSVRVLNHVRRVQFDKKGIKP